MKTIFAAAAVIALAGCGNLADTAADLPAKADAAIEEQAAVEAVVSAIDVEAVRGLAENAAREALGDVLPTKDVAAVAALIDERALVNRLDEAVDGEALRNAVRSAVAGGDSKLAAPAAE